MAEVIIADSLKEEIHKTFKGESVKIFELIYSLGENPKKGQPVGQVAGIVIKELKYGGYRFYFITDGYRIKFMKMEDLGDLLIKFVRMSDKKSQQKTIDEIKETLRMFGESGFEL